MTLDSVLIATAHLRTLIIGAGVAGLTLSALLNHRGEAPVVIERAKTFDRLHYMLGLYHLGSRVLQRSRSATGHRKRLIWCLPPMVRIRTRGGRFWAMRHRPRVEEAQESSRQMGSMMFVDSLPLAWGRDQLVKFYGIEMLIKRIGTMMAEPI